MICLDCQHIESGEHKEHAKVGLGRCAFEQLPGVFVGFTRRRECAQFEQVSKEDAAKRRAWLEKLKGRNDEKRSADKS